MEEYEMTQDQSEEILSVFVGLLTTIDILFKDFKKTIKLVDNNPSDECWRRMAIRYFASVVEIACYTLKQLILQPNQVFKKKLSDDQMAFLTGFITKEKNGKKVKSPYKISVKDKVKRTFKEFAAFWEEGVRYTIADDKEWNDFCDVLETRHRITHPTMPESLSVSVEEYDKSADAFYWFSTKFDDIVSFMKHSKYLSSKLIIKSKK